MTAQPAIRLENLSKTFGRLRKVEAVRNASLEVFGGQVYGFLGPNGAGKTTTIRLLLGLLTPTRGRAFLYGQPVRQSIDVLRRVGALVEGGAFYPYLTGRKNLEVLARAYGNYDPARIEELLALVELTERSRRRFKTYSTGMKQRLGMAAALLHDPDLLILDEPTNGLDPAGIQEMRVLIRSLVDEHGKTVFLSSHMLNEVEQICDRVAIIRRGRIVHEGTVADVIEAAQTGIGTIILRAEPLEQAQTLLQTDWPVEPLSGKDNGRLRVEIPADSVPALVQRLVDAGLQIYEVTPQRRSLEDFFLEITEKTATSELPALALNTEDEG